MATREETATESTTGVMPWDNLFDWFYYNITEVTLETIIYEVSNGK